MYLEAIKQDLLFATRLWLKAPLYSALIIFVLGVGVGGNMLLFNIVDEVLIRPMPYANPRQLVSIMRTDRRGDIEAFSPKLVRFLEAQSNGFDEIAAFQYDTLNLQTTHGAESIQGVTTTPSLFQLLGSPPLLGRVLDPQLDRAGTHNAVISFRLWQRHFAGKAGTIGSVLRLNDRDYTVVGIMPKTFRFDPGVGIESGLSFSSQVDVWTADMLDPSNNRNYLLLIGRVRTGWNVKMVNVYLNTVAHRMEQQFGLGYVGLQLRAVGLRERAVRRVRPAVTILAIGGLLLLCIACANVANMLNSRTFGRRSEFATRIALGATKMRLLAQIFLESILNCLMGWLIGICFFIGASRLAMSILASALPRIGGFTLTTQTTIAGLGLSILLAAVLSIVSGLMIDSVDVTPALLEQNRSSTVGPYGHQLRRLFLGFQIALSFFLVLGALLVTRSMLNLLSVDRGFDTKGVMTAQLSLPEPQFSNGKKVATTLALILDRLRQDSTVQAAGLISILPMGGIDRSGPGLTVVGPIPITIPAATTTPIVSDGYFQTMGIRLLKGRLFTPRDTEAAPGAVIISSAMAKKYFSQVNPVGQSLTGLGGKLHFTIIGVVADVRHWGLREQPKPMLYVPYRQVPLRSLPVLIRPLTLVARGRQGRLLSASVFAKAVHSVDPSVAVYDIRSMNEVVSDTLLRDRILAWTTGAFGSLALLLAIFGVYAVVSRTIVERTQEIGIRMALGATPNSLMRQILWQEIRYAIFGLVISITIAAAFVRYLNAQLYGLHGADSLSFLMSTLTLLIVLSLSGLIPLVSLLRMQPLEAIMTH